MVTSSSEDLLHQATAIGRLSNAFCDMPSSHSQLQVWLAVQKEKRWDDDSEREGTGMGSPWKMDRIDSPLRIASAMAAAADPRPRRGYFTL
jgi:hypothetical protein